MINIDEEKTKELLLPTTGSNTKATVSSHHRDAAGITRKWEQTTTPVHPIAAIGVEPSWLSIIHTEIREDESLRILAAIAILVLSLLIF